MARLFFFPPQCHYFCLNVTSGILVYWFFFFFLFLTTKLEQLIGSVLSRRCIPVFDVTERLHVSLSGYSSRAWGAVGLTTRQTAMKDGRRRSREKRWCSSNQSVERPYRNIFQDGITRCKNNPIRTSATGWPAHIWRAVIGLLSKWAEFSSLEPESRVSLRTNWLNHNN